MFSIQTSKNMQNPSKFCSRSSSRNRKSGRQKLQSEHQDSPRVNTNFAGNILLLTLVDFDLHSKSESKTLPQILKLTRNLLKSFPCLQSFNPKQGNQPAKSKTKKENQLQLRNKHRSIAPAEGGKSIGKPPLSICNYLCSYI